MYTIIGGDGKEYGPVTSDQVRAWIAAGRANLDTKAKFLGTDEWKRLSEHPEFQAGGVPPPVAAQAGRNLAGRWVRLGAYVVDLAIAIAGMMPGMILLGLGFIRSIINSSDGEFDPSKLDLSDPRLLTGLVVLGAGALFVELIQVVLLSTRGQTLGMLLMSIRIVRFIDGSKPGFFRAVLIRRWVIGLFCGMPYLGRYLFVIDSCFIFRADRRCVHDLMADTLVVRTNPSSE